MARKKKPPPPPRQRSVEYHAERQKDLEYYILRSGLSNRSISDSLGFSPDWLYQTRCGRFKRPCDQRISVIIEFLKDYERLQSYYFTLAKMCKRRKSR